VAVNSHQRQNLCALKGRGFGFRASRFGFNSKLKTRNPKLN
jgi:hypothetical protein